MMKNLLTTLLIFSTLSLFSQEIGFGFRAGLNFNSLIGDSEMDGNTELEDFTGNTGFHVGATFNWKATELMGVRGELVFNQKGGRRSYEGPSYLTLTTNTGSKIPSTGKRKQDLNLTMSYIDIPIVGYFKPIEQLEIFAGASLGFLVSASVFGEVDYSEAVTVATNSGVTPFRYEIDGNYISGDPGEAVFDNPPMSVLAGGTSVVIPASAGVYYEFEEDRGNLYKAIDVGAVAGISVFLNGSLFISGRVNYGLSDITKQEADVSLKSLENGQFVTQDDRDRIFSFQTSIGFSF